MTFLLFCVGFVETRCSFRANRESKWFGQSLQKSDYSVFRNAVLRCVPSVSQLAEISKKGTLSMLRKLMNDEAGFIVSAELVLVFTLEIGRASCRERV